MSVSRAPTEVDWPVVAEAPAKLNLGLHIVGRRPDGYHDLRTVFQAIDLTDELRFRPRPDPGILLRVDGPESAPAGEQNLVVKAGERLVKRLGGGRGAEILLTKRIPARTGLGGGSSDAAAALLGLLALWGEHRDANELARQALDLGSDVPFFLMGGTALGEGRGEILTPLPPPPACGWLLVIPSFRISTRKAFQALPQRLTGREPKTTMLETALKSGEFKAFIESIENDLEVGVVRIQPRLARIRQEVLSRGAAAVGLTGSGSALFAVFRSQGNAEKLLEEEFQPGEARLLACRPVDFGARVISRN
jgi:4-diphosphocytidyl-2-C-methyl-D-erythritol kinase